MSMGMGMGGGGHGGMGMGLMRSLRRDNSVLQQQLPKGIVRRIATLRPALPAPSGSSWSSSSSTPSSAPPTRSSTGRSSTPGSSASTARLVIVSSPLIVGGLAIFDAVLSLWQRWVSARVGEGLIYDMRTQVFAHVQQMPHRLLHPHPDRRARLPAQQRRARRAAGLHRHLVVGRQQPRSACGLTLAAMFFLSWQITLVALVLLPVFVFPARCVGRRLAEHHPRVLHPQRRR